jgi:hypothetical protein
MKKLLFVIIFLSFISIRTEAGESIGRYCWQLGYPFDDVICLTVEDTSPYTFALFGGMTSLSGGYTYPISGNVITDGSIYSMQLQTAGTYDDIFVSFPLEMRLNLATLSGNWSTRILTVQIDGPISYLGAFGDKDAEADPEEDRRGLFERGL